MRQHLMLCINNCMSYNNVGLVWTADSFDAYLKTLPRPSWCSKVCLHHTAAPSLVQRPKGFTAQHIINMSNYYKSLGWKSGPHLFIDEDQAWGMSPLSQRGVHAASFNSTSIGIEVLGEYDSESNTTGRGLQCWQMAAKVTKSLFAWLNVPVNSSTLLFHRDDPKTKKTCPGRKVSKDWFINLVNESDVLTPITALNNDDAIVYQGVIDYAVKHKGYTNAEATKLLRRNNKLFFFGNDWLEGAYYDATMQRTVAPIKELELIVAKSSC